MLEKDLEAKCRQFVMRELGGECLKTTPCAGFPDRMILLPGGLATFVEFKQLGKKPRKLQAFWISRLHELGFEARCIDHYEAFVKTIRP